MLFDRQEVDVLWKIVWNKDTHSHKTPHNLSREINYGLSVIMYSVHVSVSLSARIALV